MIDVAKLESGRVQIAETVFDLQALLTAVVAPILPKAAAKRLQLIHEAGADLPCYLAGDEGKIRRIVANLLDNAVKFTTEGGIALRSRTSHRDGRDWLEIEVEDSGRGIADDDRDRIFGAFEQSAAVPGANSGTGLGLTVGREYARLMGGVLVVVSAPGQGSCFRLSVPVAKTETPPVPEQVAPRRLLRLKPGLPPCRILVVDDRDTNREILGKMLAAAGCLPIEAVNGQAGIEAFLAHRPQLVLMDVTMPVMDGREATRRLRALPEGEEVPIVAVSASVFEDQLREVMEAGANGFLRKPLREEELFAQLLTFLPRIFEYGGESELPAPSPLTSTAELARELAGLPGELCDRLQAAAGALDRAGLLEAMAPFAAEAPGVAGRLRELADGYRFDLIEELVGGRPATPGKDAAEEAKEKEREGSIS